MSSSGAPRVLVVDDEPSIVDAVATALRYEAYDVAQAGNGRDALARALELEPSLIVLDWMLPDIDGTGVVRRLYDFGGNVNVVETYVSYLRKKLEASGPPLIKTVRQAGYMLELARPSPGRGQTRG
jgi:DNA-binding response OmpR family regulator